VGSPSQCMGVIVKRAGWHGEGYHLHEVNMHDVHISTYAHMRLCKREKKRENVEEKKKKKIPGLHGRAQWRRGPNSPQQPPSISVPLLHLTLGRTMCFSFAAPE